MTPLFYSRTCPTLPQINLKDCKTTVETREQQKDMQRARGMERSRSKGLPHHNSLPPLFITVFGKTLWLFTGSVSGDKPWRTTRGTGKVLWCGNQKRMRIGMEPAVICQVVRLLQLLARDEVLFQKNESHRVMPLWNIRVLRQQRQRAAHRPQRECDR